MCGACENCNHFDHKGECSFECHNCPYDGTDHPNPIGSAGPNPSGEEMLEELMQIIVDEVNENVEQATRTAMRMIAMGYSRTGATP